MKTRIRAVKTSVFLIGCICCTLVTAQEISLADFQVIGSHNSYKAAIEPALWELLFQRDPKKATSLQYTHPSLVAQLDMGLRNLELDVYADPKGGHFGRPKGLEWVAAAGQKPAPYDETALQRPGLKLFHIQDIDFRSHHVLFRDALSALRSWSDAHPNHEPIYILMNTNDKKREGLTGPLPFDEAALDSLDAEIRTFLGADKVITPDNVRGKYASLTEAITSKQAWPSLDEARGKFLFILDEKQARIEAYRANHPRLCGRVLFPALPMNDPDAAILVINDPIKDFLKIRRAVEAGYIVRTRADAGTKEARTNDLTRFEMAKASGAQVISTDYYVPSTLFKSTFQVRFTQGAPYCRVK